MISVKTLIFCNIPRIKSQSIHPVISRKKQSSEVVIALRHDNHIRLIKNIFTPKNALPRTKSFKILHYHIFWNSFITNQITLHRLWLVRIRAFLSTYDDFFYFPMVIQSRRSLHSRDEIRICLTRFHLWRSSQNQGARPRRHLAHLAECPSIGQMKNPYIRPEHEQHHYFYHDDRYFQNLP